jgi:6-pyruvoyl-tetrahydropterin synthase
MALTAVTKRYSFRGVHSLESGVHREKYHGHFYAFEVSFQNARLGEIDRVVSETVLSVLDGHDLTKIAAPATGEVLVEWIHNALAPRLKEKLLGVALQETRKNRFVSAGSVVQLI